MDNHYAVLNVAMDAPASVVRAAYRALVARFHPDRHGRDPLMLARMQQVTAAYRVLSDAHLRAEHDVQLRRARRRRAGDASHATSVAEDARVVLPSARDEAMQVQLHALRARRARAAADYAAHAMLR